MSRLAGMSSVVTAGGSSSRGATSTTSGLAPTRPWASCHSIVTFASSRAGTWPVRTVAPAGATVRPSTVADLSSRLAVAATATVLPLTGAITPPRTS
jgi:hypothetical protein